MEAEFARGPGSPCNGLADGKEMVGSRAIWSDNCARSFSVMRRAAVRSRTGAFLFSYFHLRRERLLGIRNLSAPGGSLDKYMVQVAQERRNAIP